MKVQGTHAILTVPMNMCCRLRIRSPQNILPKREDWEGDLPQEAAKYILDSPHEQGPLGNNWKGRRGVAKEKLEGRRGGGNSKACLCKIPKKCDRILIQERNYSL